MDAPEPKKRPPASTVAHVWKYKSSLLLIAVNLIPLGGVLVLGWTAFDVVFLFWMENVVIGAFNVLKMLTVGLVGDPNLSGLEGAEPGIKLKELSGGEVRPDSGSPQPAAPLSPGRRVGSVAGMGFLSAFFAFHYGMFCFVHGVFVVGLLKTMPLGLRGAGPALRENPFNLPHHIQEAIQGGFLYALIALALSHGFSFVSNFLIRREYAKLSARRLMTGVYGRVVALHLAILFGGFVSMFLPSVIVSLLVLLKIALDLKFHLMERESGVVRLVSRRRRQEA
jgi:hypothetical protein